MTNEMQVFNFNGSEIRIVEKDGQPWWVAKDVCDYFGDTNRNRTMQALDEDEKGYTQMTTPGGPQSMAVVSEAGLYAMLFAMQPEKGRGVTDEYVAERQQKITAFKRWVTHEVLPSIRKHGMYTTPGTVEDLLASPDTFIKILQEIKAERQRSAALALQNAKQEQIIHELKPKADYTDKILQNRGLVTITQIAKDYGMSGEAMNALLHELGIQYKQSDQWLLYAKYQSKGYTHSHTIDITRSDGSPDVKMNTKWTQKGRLFLYDTLRRHGTLPMIERSDF